LRTQQPGDRPTGGPSRCIAAGDTRDADALADVIRHLGNAIEEQVV